MWMIPDDPRKSVELKSTSWPTQNQDIMRARVNYLQWRSGMAGRCTIDGVATSFNVHRESQLYSFVPISMILFVITCFTSSRAEEKKKKRIKKNK